jgi:HEAT repeat protein
MGFYNLSKEERIKRVNQITNDILSDIKSNSRRKIIQYFSDEDTYIRKSAYMAVGRIYFANNNLQKQVIKILDELLPEPDFKIRQTVINAAGEIGISDFEPVEHFFDKSIFDNHHSPRYAVIGSLKKMSEKNPVPVLKWAAKYLYHEDKEIRREVCHGIELRGRKYPQDILPMLKELENDKTARVRNTLIHVLGQIAYKDGCLEIVIADLNKWTNKELTDKAVEEIIDVHDRYKDFSALTQAQAIEYIEKHYRK